MNTNTPTLSLSTKTRRTVTLCNHNYSHEGVYHPDRVMDEYDLLYMQNGEWDIWEEDTCYHLTPGDVLLLSPGCHHYSKTKCSPEMRNVYVHFTALPEDFLPFQKETTHSGSFWGAPLSYQGASLSYQGASLSYQGASLSFQEAPLSSECNAFSLVLNKKTDCSTHQSVLHTMEKIIELFWSDQLPNRDFYLSVLLDQLLIELSEIYHEQTQNVDVLITEIIHRFHTNQEKFFSPEELATDYGISLRSMSGRFKAVTGLSIHQYQLKLKLNIAYDTLPLHPGRGLRDIAHSLGFYDEFQFSKLFKRQFGISPSERRSPHPVEALENISEAKAP